MSYIFFFTAKTLYELRYKSREYRVYVCNLAILFAVFFQTFELSKCKLSDVFDSFEKIPAKESSLIGSTNREMDLKTKRFSLCVSIDFLEPLILDRATS